MKYISYKDDLWLVETPCGSPSWSVIFNSLQYSREETRVLINLLFFNFYVSRHLEVPKHFPQFLSCHYEFTDLKYYNLFFQISYQEEFQPVKYFLSKISISPIIMLKNCKIWFLSLFFNFALKNLEEYEREISSLNFMAGLQNLDVCLDDLLWSKFWNHLHAAVIPGLPLCQECWELSGILEILPESQENVRKID